MSEFIDEKLAETTVNIHQKLATWGKKWCGCFQMQMFVFWWLTSPALMSSKHKGWIFWTIPKWPMTLFQHRVGGLAESQKRQLIKALERISLASSWPSSRGWQRASVWWVQITTVCKFENGTLKSSSCKSLGTVFCGEETIQLVLILCYLKLHVKLWGNVYILTERKFDQLLQVDKCLSEKAGPMWELVLNTWSFDIKMTGILSWGCHTWIFSAPKC